MLQSKSGIDNIEYRAQRALLAKVEAEDSPIETLRSSGSELLESQITELKAAT